MDLRELQHINQLKRHPWEQARVRFIEKILGKHLTSNSTFVDIGCGDLFFLEQISKKIKNGNYHAVDTAFTAKQISDFQEKYANSGISIYNSIEKLNENLKTKANIIFLLDVIEHIEDDKGFLFELSKAEFVDSKTIFAITVPAFQSLFSEHDVFLKHFRRYSNKQLELLTKSAKLSTIELGYFFTSLLLARWLQSKKEKLVKKETTGLAEWSAGTGITNLIKNILIIDYKLTLLLKSIGFKIPGLSNYILCKRNN